MANNNYNTRIVTGEVRFSYVNLLKPRENQFGGESKYSVTLLIPKSDTTTKQKIDTAIQAAIEKGKNGSWNGAVPPTLATPVHDGDGVRQDGTPYGEECKGHWVMTATSGLDYPPKVVDAGLNPILDATQVYSGMYGRIALNFSPYVFAGKKGVGCYISTNVQKTRDGEPFGASAPAAEDDFGDFQQPQQAANPWAGTPFNNAQQQQAQQAPIDPITGQPIGGVYGG
ncbi:DUF2815 family protein [Heyndrickxia coagulans]|uniref:DUF2815 family protein n=1 Tax=Heyndrickxia coagulans TaxID=1398 RepID=UPI0014511664|nr:DUF2815 family protein [Heyndrickxia coagulans]MED4495576.1 DUF2815 family protein [Heyndrickxia coagulans]MED4534985.1 DUF2815 family protein [Heyndrickxia coagulans]QJE31823.1 DUF2815 family protein [Heyndrickxia coagulans]